MTNRIVAVVGSGYMGGGIAQVLALSGATVRIADISEEIASKNYERLIEEAKQFVADGLFPAGRGRAHPGRTSRPPDRSKRPWPTPTSSRRRFPRRSRSSTRRCAGISAAARPDAIIGSNTSTILIGSLASRSPTRNDSSACTSPTRRRSSPVSS